MENADETRELGGFPCSCADLDVAADDSTSKTDSEQTGQNAVNELAPDLLTGDGHTFRRGGVGRSPYRRSKPKVSFADCHSPSSDFMSGDSTSSQMSSTPHKPVATSDDGVDGVRGVSGHSCCVVDISNSSPTCRSKDDTSRTGTGSVRRSQSSSAVAASKVPPPPPRITPERRAQTAAAAAGRDIALPATISGVTEGLFPPSKPLRTYHWRAKGDCLSRLGPRFSEPTIRHTPRNTSPCPVSRGTEV